MKPSPYQSLLIISSIGFVLISALEGVNTAYSGNSHRELDICSHWNGRRHFLELGERGDLHARNVTTSAYRSTLYTPLNVRNRTDADIWYQCNLELVTCAECVIRITFTYVNFSKTCERVTNSGVNGKAPNMCPCEHIQFSEPPYDTTISGQEFCGDGKVFRSKTRNLMLKFFYRATNSHVFSLQYFSERNVKIISGSPTQTIVSNYSQSTPQIISTPYFPMSYPRDYGIEQILTCEADNCQVRLEFTDFQLGLTSTLEVFDSNGQMLDSYTGEHFRPPIIISSGKSLLLQFRGNGVTGSGYRGEVSFVSAKQLKERQLVPYTDCGGMVTGPGGAITMMNMIENTTDVRLYDCIWIIKPGNNYMMMKTHISLRVDAFYGLASRSELTIRQGTTSDAPDIENILWPNNGMSKESHIVPVLTGYYIRLRGVFGMSSKLAIVYSVFNYLNCYIGSEFLCNNNHCISIRLHCDGFDHCGDGSDEPESCEEDWAHLQNDRRWYSLKPNYYFPKMEQYPDLKTATGIFVMSTLGIFAVLSGWMVILYRMGVRARHQRELQNHLQTISELLDRQEELTTDEPPDYEAPPDYEEVIKIGMEQEIHDSRQRQRRHRRHHRHDPSRSRSRSRANNNTHNSHHQSNAHSYGPSTSSAVVATTSDINSASNPMQELSTRVLSATTACDLAEQGTERQCRCATIQPMGSTTSATSISIGGELPTTYSSELQARTQQQQQHQSSSGTPTQLEECSNEFRDESLNISFTLAIPQTLTGSDGKSQQQRPKSNICTENTYLKRSWVVFNHGNQNYRVQRLRPTFSSPETFLTDFLPTTEPLNYGSNLPIERNTYNSNASIFGSELSRDPSPTIDLNIISAASNQLDTFHQIKTESNDQLPDSEKDMDSDLKALIQTEPKAEKPSCSYNKHRPTHHRHNSSGGIPYKFELETIETRSHSDSDYLTSCFGSVNNPFRVSNKKRNTFHRRHVRSKSFTNAGSRQRVTRLRRTSSADLLLQQQLSPKKEQPGKACFYSLRTAVH